MNIRVKYFCKVGLTLMCGLVFVGCHSTSEPVPSPNECEADLDKVCAEYQVLYIVPDVKATLPKIPLNAHLLISSNSKSKEGRSILKIILGGTKIYESTDYEQKNYSEKNLSVLFLPHTSPTEEYNEQDRDKDHFMTIYVLNVEGNKVMNYRFDHYNTEHLHEEHTSQGNSKSAILTHNRTHGGGVDKMSLLPITKE